MKKVLSVCAVAGALTVFAASASAQSVNMVANLTGGEEAPALVLTGAFGNASVVVDLAASELTVTLNLFNVASGITAGHIHVGARGVAGPVVLNFPLQEVTGRSGDLSLSFRLGASAFVARPDQGILTLTDAIQSITAGNAYVNVHTSVNPGGEIRGQLAVRP